MKPPYRMEARWDPEAKAWVPKSDISGLVIEARSLAEFERLVRDLLPVILDDNCTSQGRAVASLFGRTGARAVED